ncbi:response regulator [Pseudomonas sp. PSKL.D1]|uniref:response regulator n=1 Tax=Pseudomonas sp. PSKL.D1 TaxID=3029060 RepID=UPI0023816E31|nr:response regulator [Pseudomonas sp. PSKL.D1]WDY60498.1 response regulator [Pseudomonas sp. PSKL.D1]
MRQVMAETLEDSGFKVVQAMAGAAALEQLHRHSEVDLLITDIGLPGAIDGWQLADRVLQIRPELPVLFVTGYLHATNDVPAQQLMLKPFSLKALSEKAWQLMGQVAER